MLKNANNTIWILGLALLFLSATCNKSKPKEIIKNDNSKYVVKGQLLIANPYCGGAAPPRDRRNEPIAFGNQEVLIKKGNENTGYIEDVIRIKTNEDGSFELKLPKGAYCLIRDYKNQPFEDFYKAFAKDYDRFYEKKGKECYENWWKSCDLSFVVQDTAIHIGHTFHKNCFVGENPCIVYEGPMPP